MSTSKAAVTDGSYGRARFVGDAAPVAGIPLSRLANAACYAVAGIAVLVVSLQPQMPTLWLVLIGVALIGYGLKIVFTRSSYWVSSLIYVVTFFAVVAAIGMLSK